MTPCALLLAVSRPLAATLRLAGPIRAFTVVVGPVVRACNRVADALVRAITVEDVPKFLRQLEDVKAIVTSGFELSVMPLLTKGRRARIVGGPLNGLEGIIDNPANPKGIVLSVDVLQQGLHVRMPVEHLKVLP